MTFVLQSGGQFRLGASGGALGLDQAGMQFVAVEFDSWSEGSFDDEEDLPSHIGIDTSVDGSVAREAVPRFNGSSGTNPRFVWIEYDGRSDVIDVYFSSSVTKPASPTLSTSLDLEAIFGGIPSLWAGWTAATGEEAWNSHKVLNWEITTLASEPGLVSETIDVSEFVQQLRPGENVLAVQGLNISAQDPDFLIRPTLVAAQNNVVSLDGRSYFSEPTPGAANSQGVQAPAGSVSFSATGRTFVDPFVLEINAPSPTSTIRYTTDGSVPDENSTRYTGPMRIRSSARIRSRAFEPGRAPGPVTSHSYIALGSSLTNFEGGVFESNLPLMVFDSFIERVAKWASKIEQRGFVLVPISALANTTVEQ